MEIVCDTNVWYHLGQNPPTEDFLSKHKLIGTFHSIDELSRTPNLLKHPEVTRKAIQALMTYSKGTIYEPPLVYLKRLDNPRFFFNPAQELLPILQFTKLVAKGHDIAEEKADAFKAHCQKRRDDLKLAADSFNSTAAAIKPNIKDKKKHRKEDSIPANRAFISMCVQLRTKDTELSNSFDWSQIELFENVLKVVFNDLETGAIVLKENDWFDLFNMIYVTPQRKYWTADTKWVNIIKRAGMEKYLFVPETEEAKENSDKLVTSEEKK
ncbi:MAG: hypothetical protein JEZ14_07525 [Marinilabiliaceae bacterium]|nr:hypothetical protein [Marinilabiliaceae bacterium]